MFSVVAGYRNTIYIKRNKVHKSGKNAHISRWVGHCSVCRDAQYVVSQSLIESVLTDTCKRIVENHFADLNVYVIVIIDTGLKELIRQMIGVFCCCGVVL